MKKEIIKKFLNSWKQGVIEIGKAFQHDGDFKKLAEIFIEKHYAFSEEDVLFKPTFTSEKVFRNTKADAISYFVKGDISEDKGFALKPWKKISFSERKTIIFEKNALSMGNYFFQGVDGSDAVKVEYTFGYVKDNDNNLLINMHH